jgi:hypothetical protein
LSEAQATEESPVYRKGTYEILHFVQDDTPCQILRGVYPEPKDSSPPSAYQNDRRRRAQNDSLPSTIQLKSYKDILLFNNKKAAIEINSMGTTKMNI